MPSICLSETDIVESQINSLLKELDEFYDSLTAKYTLSNCQKDYSILYKNDTLRVSIFLGVMDSNDDMCWDRLVKQCLIKHFATECQTNYFACGFSKMNHDPVVLQKFTKDSKKIIISLYDSSVSESFQKNTSLLESEQLKKSKQITELFLKSLKRDDIVFYLGHSRYGTGPGFYYLPVFRSQWFSTYTSSPLLKDTVRILQQTATPPKIFGLFGCSSQRYYGEKIHSANSDIAMILSTGITRFSSQVVAAVGALNSIMGNICHSEFNDTITKHNPTPVFKLYGLFKNQNFPKFKKNNSLLFIAFFILISPVVTIISSKLYPMRNISFFATKDFWKDVIYLLSSVLISLIITFIAIISISKFSGIQFKQSLPLFFIISGAILLMRYLYVNKTILSDIINYYKASASPLIFAILIYFCINLFPTGDISQFATSIEQSAKFILIFLLLLPFYIFTTGIIKYPLFATIKITGANRILLYFLIILVFNSILTYLIINLNSCLPFYKWWIFLFFLYNQFISLLLYCYTSSTFLSVIFQTLTLSVIFSENIPGLTY
jgi:hypothetical protein